MMSFVPAPRLLVFDLDGTLIDSRIDLCNSVNATLTHFGKPELPEAVISSYIGDGASLLVPGVLESIEAIRTTNPAILMAVLTNKPVKPSRDICDHFGLSPFFFQNY